MNRNCRIKKGDFQAKEAMCVESPRSESIVCSRVLKMELSVYLKVRTKVGSETTMVVWGQKSGAKS